MEIAVNVAALLILTLWSAFFSGSEAAFFSLSPPTVKAYQGSFDRRKKLIATLLHHPRDLLVTIFMLNTLVNILVQNVSARMFGPLDSWSLNVGVPLFITLIFGEIIPKYFGMTANVAFSHSVVPLNYFLHERLAFLRRWIIAVTFPISRLLFSFLKKEEAISKKELIHVLKTSEEHEIVHRDESLLICGWLNLQEALVKELMRPRHEILAHDLEGTQTKLIHLFVDRQCSRIPIYRESLENIVGIISAENYFLHRKIASNPEGLLTILTKPFFVPENSLARLLLRRFDEMGEEIAIVVDEYGSVSGLITREDILELVIGQIEDQRDAKNLYTVQSDHEIIASGKLELAELNALFVSELSSPSNLVTVGGWLIEKLGEIPQAGVKYDSGEFLFHVLAAEKNRIRRLYIRGKNKLSSNNSNQ